MEVGEVSLVDSEAPQCLDRAGSQVLPLRVAGERVVHGRGFQHAAKHVRHHELAGLGDSARRVEAHILQLHPRASSEWDVEEAVGGLHLQ